LIEDHLLLLIVSVAYSLLYEQSNPPFLPFRIQNSKAGKMREKYVVAALWVSLKSRAKHTKVTKLELTVLSLSYLTTFFYEYSERGRETERRRWWRGGGDGEVGAGREEELVHFRKPSVSRIS
jgi:hypothetical protein